MYQQRGKGLGWGEGLSMATQWERATCADTQPLPPPVGQPSRPAVFRVGALDFQDSGVRLCWMNIM